MNYEPLPAISTFPQFNRSLLNVISPLDLSLRSAVIPITPPSTPSPPRKKFRSLEDSFSNDNNPWKSNFPGYFEKFSLQSCNSENNFKHQSSTSEDSLKPNCGNNDSSSVPTHFQYSISETIILTEDEESNDSNDGYDDDDDEFVDVLSNDDDDIQNIIRNNSEQENSENNMKNDLLQIPEALSRDKLVYEDLDLHNRAIKGFEKLFKYADSMPCERDHQEADNKKEEELQLSDKEYSQSISPSSLFKQTQGKNRCEKRRLKIRKQVIDDDNSSPVSGTIIRKLRDDEDLVVRKGDIDPAFNVVEITEEAKAIIASIENKIGSYICQLCRTLYDDPFQLAQHRCERIVHIEYKCSECDKVFNCPANLASHRRWHKPKSEVSTAQNKKILSNNISDSSKKLISANTCTEHDETSEGSFACQECGKVFRRHAYLKKHLSSHQLLNNLKSSETYKHSLISNSFYQFHGNNSNFYHQNHHQSHPIANVLPSSRLYPTAFRFPNQFLSNIDHHRQISPFSEFYFHTPSSINRLSAFQYVQGHGIHHNFATIPRFNMITTTTTPATIIPPPPQLGVK